MFAQFKDQFPQQWDKYMAMHKRVELPAKTILLQEGDISRKSFFVEKGCLRVWFNNNGKDITFQFFFENEGLKSLESFLKNIPGLFTIETLEPSVIWILEKQDFEMLMDEMEKDGQFMRQLMGILFERQLHYMKEFLSFIRDTPQERYLNLIKERPQIIKRVPQHYIASYLG